MKSSRSLRGLEARGRMQLSKRFFFRDFLYSEIGAAQGFANIREDPELPIAAGARLATDLLDPLVDTFGHSRSGRLTAVRH